MKTQSSPNRFMAILSWILVSIVAWALCPIDRNASVRTYAEIPLLLLAYGASGALLGILIGTGQAWILRQQGFRTQGWIPTTVAAYGLGFPVGLVLSILIAVLSWRLARGENLLPLTHPSTISMAPYLSALALSGGAVGLIQWSALRRMLLHHDAKMAALWIFGTWLGISFGLFVGPLPALAILPSRMTGYPLGAAFTALEHSGTGLVVGTITALILFTLIRRAERTSRQVTSAVV